MTVQLSNDSGATWKKPSDFGMMVQQGHVNDMSPNIKPRTVAIPGKTGLYYFGSEVTEKHFELPMVFIRQVGLAELQSKVREFKNFVADQYGQPREIWLRFDYDSDKYYKVYYSGSLSIERTITTGTFKLPLTAFNPVPSLIQSVENINFDSDLLWESALGFEDEYSFTITAAKTVTLNNFGSISISPTIVVSGTFNSLVLSANGKTFNYTEGISNQILIVDCEKMKVTLDGVNKLNKVTGNFIELLTGSNSVTVSGTGLNCSVSFIFRPKF